VTAVDKATGKNNKITITNDTGRLSKEQIERMVADAEKFKADDEKHAERVSAKNHLESYVYNMRNTLNDQKFKDKIDSNDKETIDKALKDAQKWLESNENAGKDEFEAKQKEVEGVCNPIVTKLYQGAGGGADGMPNFGGAGGGMDDAPQGGSGGGGAPSGPKVEEVD